MEEKRYIAYAYLDGQLTMFVGHTWTEEPKHGVLGLIYSLIEKHGIVKVVEVREMLPEDWEAAENGEEIFQSKSNGPLN